MTDIPQILATDVEAGTVPGRYWAALPMGGSSAASARASAGCARASAGSASSARARATRWC